MRIGIDLGGTKIEIAALDEVGSILYRQRIPAPRGAYDATVLALQEMVTRCEAETGQSGTIGVGIPGALSKRTGLVKNANSTWLIGRPFKQDLEAALNREVRIQNDANCFAVSEAVDGGAQGHPLVFGVILGTGVGAGVALAGRVLEGRNAIAGEWGHNPLPWAEQGDLTGRDCYCGQRGCIETYLSGPSFEGAYVAHGGESLDAGRIVERADAGDPVAITTMAQYAHQLARSLAHVINVLDPDAIVLGGGLSNITSLYEAVPKLWSQWVFSDEIDTPLLPPVHGDSGGVRGAAWLWPKE